jgi:hypothetical protein
MKGIALLLYVGAAAAAADTPVANRHAMGSVPCSWSVPIQQADHKLDVPKTIRLLKANHFTCYVQPIEDAAPMTWDDFNRLLPAAQEAGIDIWPVLLPKHEGYSPPYRADFVRWAGELARLSLQYPVMRGFNIDDTDKGGNENVFTHEYFGEIYRAKQKINPALLFVPTIYDLDSAEADLLAGVADGAWLWWTNLEQNNGLRASLENGRLVARGRFPVYGGVYAHTTSWHNQAGPKPALLKEALDLACGRTDGAVIWQLPLTEEPNPWLEIARQFVAAGKCGSH